MRLEQHNNFAASHRKARAATVLALMLMLASEVGVAAESWRSFFSVSPFWRGNTDIDNGGDFGAGGVVVRGGASGVFGAGHRVSVTLRYDYTDYDFSERTAFGGAPWGNVQSVGFSVPLLFSGSNGWFYGITPSLDWNRENGADWSDSLVYGGIISATKVFAPDRRLGFGMGVFDDIEETDVIPIVIIDWRLSERWRLVNPLPAGPAGPAGIELDYSFDNGWNLGLGAAYRSQRFRLSENGPVPGGVGEDTGVPVFLRASTDVSDGMSFFLYAGAVVGGELRVEDADGNEVREESVDPAPLFGATFRMRF